MRYIRIPTSIPLFLTPPTYLPFLIFSITFFASDSQLFPFDSLPLFSVFLSISVSRSLSLSLSISPPPLSLSLSLLLSLYFYLTLSLSLFYTVLPGSSNAHIPNSGFTVKRATVSAARFLQTPIGGWEKTVLGPA